MNTGIQRSDSQVISDPCKLLVVRSLPKLIITSWWSPGFDAAWAFISRRFPRTISVIFLVCFLRSKNNEVKSLS